MKRILFLSSFALCAASALLADNGQPNPAAVPLGQPVAPAASSQPMVTPPPAPVPAPGVYPNAPIDSRISYPKYTAELAFPLISPETRRENERRYRDVRLADLATRGHALDSYIFDGLRLVRTYGPFESKPHHHEHGISPEKVAREYRITPGEAAAWIEASRQFYGRYADPVDRVQADLLPQASANFNELLRYLPRREAREIMPGTAAYLGYDRPEPVVVQPQTVIVAPQPVIVQPAPAVGVNVGGFFGGGHRW
jgi:hypothetical protein